MSFSLGGEQLGSSQESSSFWEFMATNSGKNEEVVICVMGRAGLPQIY